MFGDSGSKSIPTPQFPLFLLPSLKIPFRRRQASTSAVSTESPTSRHSSVVSASSPPSLSSSPGSSIDDDTLGSSPVSSTSPASFAFVSAPTFTPSSSSPPDRDRLARTAPDTLRCNTCSTDVAFGAQIVSKGFTGRHGRAYLVSAPLAAATPSCPSSPTGNGTSPLAAKAKVKAKDGGNLVNVRVGRPENRQLVTGAHVVADIHCAVCGAKLGWKYVDAREQAQKYKVGKFILETQRVVAHRSWEDVPASDGEFPSPELFYAAEVADGGAQGRRAAGGRRVSAASIDEVLEGEEQEDDDEGDADGPVVFDSEDEDECEDIFAGTWDAEVVAKRRSRKVGPRKKAAV